MTRPRGSTFMKSNTENVFHRQISRSYPAVVKGEGVYLWDENGKRYLDGAAGVFVAILGQGVDEIADAIDAEMRQVTFAYTTTFTSETERALTRKLVEWAPEAFDKAWICTSGSGANETAIKLARHYHLVRGNTGKFRVIARHHSYHGSSIGALSLTGAVPRRQPYEPLLLDFPHISPPNCYRCPLDLIYPSCGAACASELEDVIMREGPETISAFIVEPMAGGPLGGLVTPPEYMRAAREICDQYDVLLIVDEVISGIGRTGRNFAVEHTGVTPDIITIAKGLGAGYVPIGGVLAHKKIHAAFEEADTSFVHGESFTGHTAVSAAGLATLNYIEKHDLVRRAGTLGDHLGECMETLRKNPMVGEIRGHGLLRGVELVADKTMKRPFPRAKGVAEAVGRECNERGLLVLPGVAGADGTDGDTVVLAPPYIVTHEQIDTMVSILGEAIKVVGAEM
jgi:adenosylmethionine-8-amino-7-oxononanoate aminotransferase